MQFSALFERFAEQSPVTVMARATMENLFAPAALDFFFEQHAKQQYTKELLFSTTVDLMSHVVFRIQPSIHAAYRAAPNGSIGVSIKSVYEKLNHTEPLLMEGLVQTTASTLGEVIDRMDGQAPDLLPGYHVKILDGNHLAGTDHRLKPLRTTCKAVLPGLTLCVLDTRYGLVTDVVCCEDAYTQERVLLEQLLPRIEPNELWIEDRNFCTSRFMFGIVGRPAFFLVREHKSTLPYEAIGKRRSRGRTETGQVYEQTIRVRDEEGKIYFWRRITVVLDKKTRDGDSEIHLLTNVPKKVSAVKLADLYRKRWKLETAFADLTTILRCEIDTLAHPRAALFGFCLALLAYNILGLVRASIRAAHGEEVDEKVSSYYLAHEIAGTYKGMMVAVPPAEWLPFSTTTVAALAKFLKTTAAKVELRKYRKNSRGPKKPPPERTSGRGSPHVSTARVLKSAKKVKT